MTRFVNALGMALLGCAVGCVSPCEGDGTLASDFTFQTFPPPEGTSTTTITDWLSLSEGQLSFGNPNSGGLIMANTTVTVHVSNTPVLKGLRAELFDGTENIGGGDGLILEEHVCSEMESPAAWPVVIPITLNSFESLFEFDQRRIRLEVTLNTNPEVKKEREVTLYVP